MNDGANKTGFAGIVALTLVAILLAAVVGWILYDGPFLFGRQHPTIHAAVGAGNMKEAKSYIADNKNLIESRDSHGELPIHHAIKFRKTHVLKFLMQNGANVNGQVLRSKDTPLHYAVMMGDEEIVSLLLVSGADPLRTNVDGETPLASARKHTYSNVDRIIQLLQDAEEMKIPNQPDAGEGL